MRTQVGTMSTQVGSLTPISGLRIQRCREQWCGLQMWLRSGVAVAVVQASSCGSDWTSTCRGCSPKKTKDQKQNSVKYIVLWVFTWVYTHENIIIIKITFYYSPKCLWPFANLTFIPPFSLIFNHWYRFHFWKFWLYTHIAWVPFVCFLNFYDHTHTIWISWARDWILATAAAYATAMATPDPLTHCTRPRIKSTPPQRLKPLQSDS